MLERTFCMIKPDGVARGLVDQIKERIKKGGLNIMQSKELLVSDDQARRLYKAHEGKPFYNGLVNLITSGKVCAMLIEGEDAVSRLRELMGATDPRNADPGSIRGDLREENIFTADQTMKNLVHGSDSKENAGYEIAIFF